MYQLLRIENVSPRPIQSIGTYVSLDAESVVCGSADRNLRFLDPDNLEEIAKCQVNKKSVNCVAISEISLDGDDPIIVTGGKDSFIQIWDPTAGSLEKNIELPTNEVRSLDIYQGSQTYVLVGTKDAKVILWDVKKNVLVHKFEGHRASIHSVSITTSVSDIEANNDLDFLCIASGGADRTARTWDLATGGKRKKFRHQRSISTMVVANKGLRPILATGGVERVIHLWDVGSGILLRSLAGHLDQINSLTLWEGYQMLIISGSADGTLRIFDILSGECLCVLKGHEESVLGVTIADFDCPKLISCSDDLSLMQWDLDLVLQDFYYASPEEAAADGIMEKDRESMVGQRNRNPPFLPTVDYVAPQELDKTTLSKEERKQIRKELKREKRRKASGQYRNARAALAAAATANDSPTVESDVSAKTSNDNEDDFNFDDEDFLDISDDEELDAEAEAALARAEAAAAADALRQEEAAQLLLQEKESAGEVSCPEPVIAGHRDGTQSSRKVIPTDSAQQMDKPPSSIERRTSTNLVRGIMQKFGVTASVMPIGHIQPEDPATDDTKMTASKANSAALSRQQDRRESYYSKTNLRALANQAQNNFSIAQVERELEEDRKKKQAQAKLALRLKLKKGIAGTTAERSSVAQSVPGNSPGPATTSESPEILQSNPQEEDLNALKLEKLRQHKMQEMRRHQSMVVAKERSGQALQKRLEEIAAKRNQNRANDSGTTDDSEKLGSISSKKAPVFEGVMEEEEGSDSD